MFFASKTVSYLNSIFCNDRVDRIFILTSSMFNVSCELSNTDGKSFRIYVIAFSKLSMPIWILILIKPVDKCSFVFVLFLFLNNI
jgi:hypothetical protein